MQVDIFLILEFISKIEHLFLFVLSIANDKRHVEDILIIFEKYRSMIQEIIEYDCKVFFKRKLIPTDKFSKQ